MFRNSCDVSNLFLCGPSFNHRWKLLDFAELKHSSISFFDIEKHETAISRWSRARTRAAKVFFTQCFWLRPIKLYLSCTLLIFKLYEKYTNLIYHCRLEKVYQKMIKLKSLLYSTGLKRLVICMSILILYQMHIDLLIIHQSLLTEMFLMCAKQIDPRHRYGHNLHFYYDKWLQCQSREPFFYW